MYENSKHANWLLATLLFTLLLSSLILGWLLTRASVFANPSLLTSAPSTERTLATHHLTKTYLESSIQVPQITSQQLSMATVTISSPAITAKATPTIEAINQNLPLPLLDSQDYLEQAAIIPKAVLPLASLAANQSIALPKTTAPTALIVHGLVDTTTPLPAHQAKSAWLYAGQYQNGKWNLLGLDLATNTLPEANHHYKLIWGAKVRSAPPGQRMSTGSDNLAESIGYLAEGSSIQVLSVKQSGKNGHIWLEIAYEQ